MEYIRENNGYMEKYNVIYDEEELKKLNKKIILRCGLKEHRDYISDYFPLVNGTVIDNYNCEEVSINKKDKTKKMFHFIYDEFQPTKLSRMIDRFIDNRDFQLIDAIMNYNYEAEDVTGIYKNRFEGILKEMNECLLNYSYDRIDQLLENIKYFQDKLALNQDRMDDSYFITELRNLITIEYLDRIELDTFKKAKTFIK